MRIEKKEKNKKNVRSIRIKIITQKGIPLPLTDDMKADRTGSSQERSELGERHPEGPAQPVVVHGHRSEA